LHLHLGIDQGFDASGDAQSTKADAQHAQRIARNLGVCGYLL